MEKTNAPYEAMLSLLAELTLDDSLQKFRLNQLYKEIDRALANRDVEQFLTLSGELKLLRAKQTGRTG